MTISTLTDLRAARRDVVTLRLPSTSSTGGYLGGNSTNPGDTTSGLVPTAGFDTSPTLNLAGSTGYITRISAYPNSPMRIFLFDRLFHVGQFAATSNTQSLSSQPSYSGRVPGGDYSGLQVWWEALAQPGGTETCSVTYTNQSGTAGQTSPNSASVAINLAGPRTGPIPLASGDSGIQLLESVTWTISNASHNTVFYIARPLAVIRVDDQTTPVELIFDRTKMPLIYDTSCLQVNLYRDAGTAGGSIDIEIASN